METILFFSKVLQIIFKIHSHLVRRHETAINCLYYTVQVALVWNANIF